MKNLDSSLLKEKIGFQKYFLFLIFSLIISNQALAQDKSYSESSQKIFTHAINICPIAPAFGIYAINYEQLISPHNGIVLRVEYEAIPDSYTEANIEAHGKAIVLNYRRHFNEDLNKLHFGAYARYRIYDGDGAIENQSFTFKIKDVTIGLNAGKRWIFNNGFNIQFMMGYGYTFWDRDVNNGSEFIDGFIDEFEDEYDFLDSFLGEFSIGYAF